jgi:hypothetical protein
MHARSAPTARTGNPHGSRPGTDSPERRTTRSQATVSRARASSARQNRLIGGAVRAAAPADRERRQISAARRAPLVVGLRHEP